MVDFLDGIFLTTSAFTLLVFLVAFFRYTLRQRFAIGMLHQHGELLAKMHYPVMLSFSILAVTELFRYAQLTTLVVLPFDFDYVLKINRTLAMILILIPTVVWIARTR